MDDAPGRVDEPVLEDLRSRLRATRRVPLPLGVGWQRGTDADYLADLVGYWAREYDWRVAEDRIRRLPWVRTVHQRFTAHSVHQPASNPAAPVVVLLHGWPDSVLRFERLLPGLTDLNVVVPALPGFPFSEPLVAPGMSATARAEVIAGVMIELGYHRYVISAGDVGSSIAQALAARYPERVSALHLTDVPFRYVFAFDPAQYSAAETAYLAAGQQWQAGEGAYAHQQSTKPHTLAAALADSPAGLASWIVEKLRGWSDCHGDVESVFPREDLLTWITAYWVTSTIGSSFSPYVEAKDLIGRLNVPTVITQFAADLVPAPREFTERLFDVRSFTVGPAGGHFAAWEQPHAFTAGLRAALTWTG